MLSKKFTCVICSQEKEEPKPYILRVEHKDRRKFNFGVCRNCRVGGRYKHLTGRKE